MSIFKRPKKPTTERARGIFLVLEGTDGSGKGTQFKQLADRLNREGYEVACFDFPRYDESASHFVRQYLNGAYGTADQVGPYAGSLFYALDRYEAGAAIRQALEAGKIVLANRFTGSNMAHQGAKFNHADERRGFFIWLDNLEFEMLQVPRPDLSLVLRVPAATAQQLVDQKDERSYTTKKRDIHEADLDHLERSVKVFDDLCQLFPQDFQRLDCVRSGQLMSVQQIHDLVWERVRPHLPAPAPLAAVRQQTVAAEAVVHQSATSATKAATDASDNPYITKQSTGTVVTDAGLTYLRSAVTDPTGPVYGFTGKLTPVTIAAAMARLSRRGDDMRVVILDEFANAIDKDTQLLQRVITAYGDDSVQQLVGQHFVFEDASNLLTKKLERGRLAAYLEQSTRYIYYDQKRADGSFKYHVPEHFDESTKTQYRRSMDAIFERYSQLVRQLTDYVRSTNNVPAAEQDAAWKGATRAQACDAARAMLPVVTVSTVGLFASGQALEGLILRLQSDELPEARAAGQALLREARKTMPTFLERADKPERGGAFIAYRANTRRSMADLAQRYTTPTHTASTDTAVQLTNVWPRNELDLVPDMLYEFSDTTLDDLCNQVASWPYDRRAEVFTSYMGERLNRRHRPGRALETAHYSWDIVCDYGIFRDLQRHRMVDDLSWQELTPRLGYEVPDLVDQAGLSDLFEECFDISLQLHSLLVQAGYGAEAQYATLLGHRMRWKLTYNAREAFHLHELRTSPQGHPGYRKLVKHMHEQVALVHPLMAAAMQFVNQDEDPELTRLAAERYTQYKLDSLAKAGLDNTGPTSGADSTAA